MSLTIAQHKILVKYLKDVGIKCQEPFEEFYDHIATGFEKSDETDLDAYIRNIVQPGFQGVDGIKRVLKEGSKTVTRHYRRVLLKKMTSFFIGYRIIIPLSLCLVFYLLFSNLEPQKVFSSTLVLMSASPALLSLSLILVFRARSYKQKLGYNSSLKHEELHRISILGVLILNLHIILFLDMDSFVLNTALHTWLPILVIGYAIFAIWAASCIQLIKEELTPKLIIQ
jgi:hypothetical protein